MCVRAHAEEFADIHSSRLTSASDWILEICPAEASISIPLGTFSILFKDVEADILLAPHPLLLRDGDVEHMWRLLAVGSVSSALKDGFGKVAYCHTREERVRHGCPFVIRHSVGEVDSKQGVKVGGETNDVAGERSGRGRVAQ